MCLSVSASLLLKLSVSQLVCLCAVCLSVSLCVRLPDCVYLRVCVVQLPAPLYSSVLLKLSVLQPASAAPPPEPRDGSVQSSWGYSSPAEAPSYSTHKPHTIQTMT